MNNSDAVEAYLEAKRKRAFDLVNGTTNLAELDGKAAIALDLAKVEMPCLDLSNRKYESITEQPTFQPYNMPLTMGVYYEGVRVAIPVKGDFALFTKFIEGRAIDGLSIGGNAIQVKQFAFAGGGAEEAKERAKNSVETLESTLAYLTPKLDAHYVALSKGVDEALEERREVITTKQQKDANADPWGN